MKDSNLVGPQVLRKSRKTNVSSNLQRLASRSLLAVGVLFSLTACAAQSQPQYISVVAQPKEGEEFSYAWLKGHARLLRLEPYESHQR